MSKHHDPASVAPRGAWRKRRILGVPVPVAIGLALAGTTAAVAALVFGVTVSGKGGRSADLAASWIQPTGSLGYGTLTDADVPMPSIVGSVLTIPGDGVVMLPGDAASYGARIQNNTTGIGAYISGISLATPLPAGWRVEFDTTTWDPCGIAIQGTGGSTNRPVYLKVTNVSGAPGSEVDLTGAKVTLQPLRSASAGWGQYVGGGVTCPAVVGA